MTKVNLMVLAAALTATSITPGALLAQGIPLTQQGGYGAGGGGQQGGFPGGQQGGFNGGGPGQGFGGPGPGQMGGPFMAQKVTAVTTSITTLTTVLKLTDSQRSEVAAIQQEYRQKLAELTPRPQNAGFGQWQTQAQGRPAMMDSATRAKASDLADTTSKQLEMALTSDQQTALVVLLQQLQELSDAQISPQLYSMLSVSNDQYTQITAIETSAQSDLKQEGTKDLTSGEFDSFVQAVQDSHRQVHEKVLAILTPAQSLTLQSMSNQRPGQGFGGPMGGGQFGGGPQMMSNSYAVNGSNNGSTNGNGNWNGNQGGFGGPSGPGGPGGPGNNGPGGPPPTNSN